MPRDPSATMWVVRTGLVPYDEARATQKRLEAARIKGDVPDLLLLLEHPPVYTRGRRSTPEGGTADGRSGLSILVSSHILPELEELCTSVAIIDRGQVLAQGRVADIERRLRVGAVYRVRVLGDDDAIAVAQAWFSGQVNVVSAQVLDDGSIEIGFHGDDDGAAALLAAAVRSDLRVATFARAASDLEELFLQVTAQEPVAAGAVA